MEELEHRLPCSTLHTGEIYSEVDGPAEGCVTLGNFLSVFESLTSAGSTSLPIKKQGGSHLTECGDKLRHTQMTVQLSRLTSYKVEQEGMMQ